MMQRLYRLLDRDKAFDTIELEELVICCMMRLFCRDLQVHGALLVVLMGQTCRSHLPDLLLLPW